MSIDNTASHADLALPPSGRGMRIGLFGGSFNPPHDGHRLVARQALKRLGLDAVWWLVTPGNPLKDHRVLKPLAERIALARGIIDHPRVRVTGFEAAHGFRYTYETLAFLKASLPGRRFVWIMGADNLKQFHHWERWRDIVRMMPIAVYVRPGHEQTALSSPAAHILARYRMDETDASILAETEPPTWMYLTGLKSDLSSTRLRATRPDYADMP